MLVRKFLRCKLTEEAQAIVDNINDILKNDNYGAPCSFTDEEFELIKQSLYKTERTWEMEK